jgi:hypothetical protein
MFMGDTRFFTYPLRYPLSLWLRAVMDVRGWTLEDRESAEGLVRVSVADVGLRTAYCSMSRIITNSLETLAYGLAGAFAEPIFAEMARKC